MCVYVYLRKKVYFPMRRVSRTVIYCGGGAEKVGEFEVRREEVTYKTDRIFFEETF